MRATSVTQFDFGSGETSPWAFGRTDDSRYASGLALSKDFIPRSEGPISNRPGTQKFTGASVSAGVNRMIPFSPTTNQGYLFELFGAGLRVIKPGTVGLTAEYIVLTSVSDYSNLRGTYEYSRVSGNYKYFLKSASNTDFNSYEYEYYEIKYNFVTDTFVNISTVLLVVGDTNISISEELVFSSGAWKTPSPYLIPQDVVTTYSDPFQALTATAAYYASADIRDVRYTESGDVLYLTHRSYPPAVLYLNSSGDWTFEVIDFSAGPYVGPDASERNIQLSLDDFDYVVSVQSQGEDFSGHSPGDYISYRDGADWVLAQYVSGDGVDVSRAKLQPVKTITSTLDPSARIEYQSTSSLLNIGALAVPTVSSNKSVFSGSLAGSWFRFIDAGSAGTGATVVWVKLINHLGSDIAASGYYYYGGVNPAEVDVFVTATAVTTVTEYGNIQDIRVVDYLGAALNETSLRSSEALFEFSRDVGRKFQVTIQNTVINCSVVAAGSNSTVQARVEVDYALPYDSNESVAEDGRTSDWRKGAFYTGNYPAACAFFAQRFVLGGTPSHPETFWNSRIDGYFDFSPRERDGTVLDTTAFSRTLAGQKFSPIRWFYTGTEMLIGTEGAFWSTGPANGIYSNLYFTLEKHADIGSILPPIKLGSVLLLVHYSGRLLFEIEYSDKQKTYRPDDGTTIPNYLFKGSGNSIVDIQVQDNPYQLIWIHRSDGTLVSLTPRWRRDDRTYALSRHVIGTPTTITDTDWNTNGGSSALISAIAPLYDNATAVSSLYLITDRGATRSMERMSFEYDPLSDVDATPLREGMLFLDSAVSRTNEILVIPGVPPPAAYYSNTSRWALPEDFNGTQVTILLDDVVWKQDYLIDLATYAPLVTPPASKLTIGYRYLPTLKMLPQSNTATSGNIGTQGRIRDIKNCLVQIYGSWGFRIGNKVDGTLLQPNSMSEINFERNDDIPRASLLHTGFVKGDMNHPNQRSTEVYIQQTQPYPLNILSVTTNGGVE